MCLIFNKGTSSVKKSAESPVVSVEKESELRSSPDRSTSVEQQNTTPTSQNVIARVHQLLEVNISVENNIFVYFSYFSDYKLVLNEL